MANKKQHKWTQDELELLDLTVEEFLKENKTATEAFEFFAKGILNGKCSADAVSVAYYHRQRDPFKEKKIRVHIPWTLEEAKRLLELINEKRAAHMPIHDAFEDFAKETNNKRTYSASRFYYYGVLKKYLDQSLSIEELFTKPTPSKMLLSSTSPDKLSSESSTDSVNKVHQAINVLEKFGIEYGRLKENYEQLQQKYNDALKANANLLDKNKVLQKDLETTAEIIRKLKELFSVVEKVGMFTSNSEAKKYIINHDGTVDTYKERA